MLRLRIYLPLALLVCAVSSARAQLPAVTLSALNPSGGQSGTTFDVMLTGIADGEGVDRLLFSHPGIKAVAAMQPSPLFPGKMEPTANKFSVTIAADVPPGLYDVRAAGTFGVSNPRAFAVDQWKEIVEPAGNQTADKAAAMEVGSVMNAVAAANAEDWFRFSAKKGSRVIIDVLGQRLDSKIDATLVLYDASLKELARNRDANRRDPLIDLMVPADGDYLIKVYDFTYGGGVDYGYRLAVHQGPYVDFVFPPVVQAGVKNKITVYGRNLPGGKPAEGVAVMGRQLEKMEFEVNVPADEPLDRRATPSLVQASEVFIDGREFHLKTSAGRSNSVLLGYATEPVVVEQEPNEGTDKNQAITVPCEIVGQFAKRGDLDAYEFSAKKGDLLSIEVVSQRMGFKADPAVLVQQGNTSADGKVTWGDIKELDDEAKNVGGTVIDAATNDLTHNFTAPIDGKFRVVVRDLYGDSRSDPRLIYRLIVRKPRPDFRLAVFANAYAGFKDNGNGNAYKPIGTFLRAGETGIVTIMAERRDGYTGPILVRAEGLPAGVTAQETVIAAGQDTAGLSIDVAENAAAWCGAVKIMGRAQIDGKEISHAARSVVITAPGAPKKAAGARMAQEVTLCIGGAEKLPVTVQLGDGKLVEQVKGTKLELPIKVTRRGDFKDALTLTVLGLPPNVKAGNITIAANAKEGKVALESSNATALGDYSFYLATQVNVNYVRDQVGADKAAKAKQEVDKLAGEMRAAADAAKKAAAGAAKEKKAEADKTAAEAEAKAKAAEAAAKTAQTQADAKKKAAEVKQIKNVPLVSTHAVVRVVEPPKPEEKKPADKKPEEKKPEAKKK